jgi:hypothetical protein
MGPPSAAATSIIFLTGAERTFFLSSGGIDRQYCSTAKYRSLFDNKEESLL